MYIRFETPEGEGIFALAGRARREGEERPRRDERGRRPGRRRLREVEHLYDWLCRLTPIPPASAYADALCRQPTTWFREAAGEHVAQAWRLCLALNHLGYRVGPVRSASPGVVLWGDEVQVVVRHHRRDDAAPELSRRSSGEQRGGWDGDRTTIRRWSARAKRRSGLGVLAGGAALAEFERALAMGAPARRGRRASERGDWVHRAPPGPGGAGNRCWAARYTVACSPPHVRVCSPVASPC